MPDRPMLYLVSGLPCSGKSTYARELEGRGVIRVCIDELMIESVGRLGLNYDASEHMGLLEPVLTKALDRVPRARSTN